MKKIDVILLGVLMIALSTINQICSSIFGDYCTIIYFIILFIGLFFYIKKASTSILIFFTLAGNGIGEIYKTAFFENDFAQQVSILFGEISVDRIIGLGLSLGIILIATLAVFLNYKPLISSHKRKIKIYNKKRVFVRCIAWLVFLFGLYIKLDAMSEEGEIRERASYYLICLFIFACIIYIATTKTSQQKQGERFKEFINPSS